MSCYESKLPIYKKLIERKKLCMLEHGLMYDHMTTMDENANWMKITRSLSNFLKFLGPTFVHLPLLQKILTFLDVHTGGHNTSPYVYYGIS